MEEQQLHPKSVKKTYRIVATFELDVNILNMNIPWSENPAGMDPNVYTDYSKFGSVNYLGTKE